eukprot:357923-Chlamydomonas_euryale.AAC.1
MHPPSLKLQESWEARSCRKSGEGQSCRDRGKPEAAGTKVKGQASGGVMRKSRKGMLATSNLVWRIGHANKWMLRSCKWMTRPCNCMNRPCKWRIGTCKWMIGPCNCINRPWNCMIRPCKLMIISCSRARVGTCIPPDDSSRRGARDPAMAPAQPTGAPPLTQVQEACSCPPCRWAGAAARRAVGSRWAP